MPGLFQRIKEKARAPFVQSVKSHSLVDWIQFRRDAVRNHKWIMQGYLMGISFGPSGNAAYNTEPVQQKWTKATAETGINEKRRRMLNVIWEQANYPVIGHAGGNVFVLPAGLSALPKANDGQINVVIDPKNPPKEMTQDLLDYVDGFTQGRDGTTLLVIQPVVSLAMVTCDRIRVFRGHADPANGTYPALMFTPPDPRTGEVGEALLVGGMLLEHR